MINLLSTSPDKRKAILDDLYGIHCDGLNILYLCVFSLNRNGYVEVVLNENEELFRTMIQCGILEQLVDIMTSVSSDPGTLV